MSNKNILYIVSGLDRGGLELRLLDFAKRFPDNYKIHICVTSDRLDLLEQFQEMNAKIIVVSIKRAYWEFEKIFQIYAYIAENNIQIVNTFDFKGLLVGCLLKLRTRSRIALIHNTVDLLHSYNRRRKFILKYLLFLCVDKFVCNSLQAKDVLASIGINKTLIEVINNGVDTGKFCSDPVKRLSMRERYGIDEYDAVIGTVANFRWEKNYPFLVDSFCALADKRPNIWLLCVGGGTELERIKTLAKSRGVYEKTIFTDYIDNVPDYLQMMDVFVLCSVKESFPNCMIQAMSVGLPVVASDIGACTDIIQGGINGLKFEINDTAHFVESIERLLLDKTLYQTISINGNSTVNIKYSEASMIENYIKLYDEKLTGAYHARA